MFWKLVEATRYNDPVLHNPAPRGGESAGATDRDPVLFGFWSRDSVHSVHWTAFSTWYENFVVFMALTDSVGCSGPSSCVHGVDAMALESSVVTAEWSEDSVVPIKGSVAVCKSEVSNEDVYYHVEDVVHSVIPICCLGRCWGDGRVGWVSVEFAEVLGVSRLGCAEADADYESGC